MGKANQAPANPETGSAPLSESERLDRDLARDALVKRKAGQKPSVREASALRRVEKKREEELRWKYYRSIPQRHYRQMSGRQAKVLNEQAARWGMPVGGKQIDLIELLQWLHQFFADNKHGLAGLLENDKSNLSARQRLDEIKVERERMLLEKELEKLVEREVVRSCLNDLGRVLRNCGETLRDQCGDEPYLVLQEAIEDFDQALEDGDLSV